MIGSLLYLTATWPDIQFIVGLCTRFQASPRSSHRMAVQRVFRYLKHTPKFGIWYSASSSLDLVHFSDADFGVRFEKALLMCNNTSAISVAKNPVFHEKMRHVERRHHFLRDHVEKGDIEMRYIDTER
jgi:hypothetical protein